jgi:hypothetical protein
MNVEHDSTGRNFRLSGLFQVFRYLIELHEKHTQQNLDFLWVDVDLVLHLHLYSVSTE